MQVFEFSYPVSTKTNLPSHLLALVNEAEAISANAYAPYSNFMVGAAILLGNGKIVTGANQENAAYPSGICAERTAIYYAGAQYPNEPIVAIAFAARRTNESHYLGVAPCGACRQAILEYESKQELSIMQVLPLGDDNFALVPSIANLLPFSFDKDSL